MSTPRDLLDMLNDLAKRVAERQLAENDAVESIKYAVRKYPEVSEKWTEERAASELDKRVKREIAKRNKDANAKVARKLAELGLERPTLDGEIIPISQDDESYSITLDEHSIAVDVHIANAWRMLKSFERDQEEHEVLVAAAGGNTALTREQAVDLLKKMPEEKRKALRMEVRAKLSAERRAFAERRYGAGSQAAEG